MKWAPMAAEMNMKPTTGLIVQRQASSDIGMNVPAATITANTTDTTSDRVPVVSGSRWKACHSGQLQTVAIHSADSTPIASGFQPRRGGTGDRLAVTPDGGVGDGEGEGEGEGKGKGDGEEFKGRRFRVVRARTAILPRRTPRDRKGLPRIPAIAATRIGPPH